ncbi:MAG: ABC transporter permease [Gammaproteobacteria bacterium]|nr:ABC transporter permease [Gammaproteobacteria bacterium]
MHAANAPRFRHAAFAVWARNMLVLRKMAGTSLVINFGEPLLYLLAFGFGLGMYIGNQMDMPYLTFLASGMLAASAMNTAGFEALYGVFTRMVPQKSYDAMLASPLEIADILTGELLYCATKSVLHGSGILLVAALLGAVHDWQALWVLPILFLVGLTFAALAMIVTAFATTYAFFSYYTTLVMMPLMLLSGVFYPIAVLPPLVQQVLYGLPLVHAVQLMRPLVSGQPMTNTLLHFFVLVVYAVGGYLIALRLIRKRLRV